MEDPGNSQQPTHPGTPTGPVNKPSGYGKRPLWQWILLYVIIAAIVYVGVYYLFIHKSGSSSSGSSSSQHSTY